MTDMEAPAPMEGKQDITENTTAVTERKIIKNGDLNFESTDVNETRRYITKLVSDVKGYVSADNAQNYDSKTEVRMTVRIPSGKFDQVLNNVSEKASRVDSKSVNAQDVTAEFIDVEARVKTKKELESRYKALLSKANSVTEILSIEKELGTLRGEIESVEGRLKYLNDNVSFSTLNFTFYERTGSEFGFGSKFTAAVGDGWQNVLAFLIGLISLWPFILIGVIIIVFWRRRRRRIREKTLLK